MSCGQGATMVFDTDILIWIQRGNHKAASLVQKTDHRFIALQTYLELLQQASNKKQHRYTREFLTAFAFTILPLNESIGHRAAVYIEEYGLSSGLRAGDALVAATATENRLPLITGNGKHFRTIKDLSLKIFKP